jgi:glycine/D-amino acid oxidase-like deaminating enzyme
MMSFSAVRTPRDLAGSGWYQLLPPPPPARQLEDDLHADWIIIGGGFAGLSAARRLTQLRGGDRIVLLEAQRIGWGAAGRNSGFMIDLPHDLNSETYGSGLDEDLTQIRLNRAAIAFARDAVGEFGLGEHFSACGKYHGAANTRGMKALKAFERHLEVLKEPYERLDASAMKRVTGSDFYLGGTYVPGTCLIQPAAYIRGLADGLRAKVSIYEDSPVVRIESGRRHVVRTSRGSVSAPKVILAVNGHIESFGFYRHRLMHVFTFASMTGKLTPAEEQRLGGQREWGLIPADPMGTTVRRIRDGRIVIRNTFTYNPSMETSAHQIERIGRRHDRSFRQRFPMLSDVTMDYRWGGHLCLSLNSAPAFGEVSERMYSACCENGIGTVKSTLAGMLIVDLAAGSNNSLLADMLSYAAPKRLYPEPFMTLGARTQLWWTHQRAGREL